MVPPGRDKVQGLMARSCIVVLLAAGLLLSAGNRMVPAQEEAPGKPISRGSLVEDRAARQLVEAGDARLDASETEKALEIWRSVIERYPRSRVRYTAHMRLGNYFLDRERAYDRARTHFEAVSSEENRDDAQRAEGELPTTRAALCHRLWRDLRMRGRTVRRPPRAKVPQPYSLSRPRASRSPRSPRRQ